MLEHRNERLCSVLCLCALWVCVCVCVMHVLHLASSSYTIPASRKTPFVHSCIRAFVHSYIRAFVYSCIHSSFFVLRFHQPMRSCQLSASRSAQLHS